MPVGTRVVPSRLLGSLERRDFCIRGQTQGAGAAVRTRNVQEVMTIQSREVGALKVSVVASPAQAARDLAVARLNFAATARQSLLGLILS
jgi:hypothetical protein